MILLNYYVTFIQGRSELKCKTNGTFLNGRSKVKLHLFDTNA